MSDFSFEQFAQTEEYRRINLEIVKDWIQMMVKNGVTDIENMLDLATGTGLMARLFIENAPKEWSFSTIVCVDKAKEALISAAHELFPLIKGKGRNAMFCHTSIEKMRLHGQKSDIAVWGNGIHYLPADLQETALICIRGALKSNGWLFFNTSFYSEAIPENTRPFYQSQVRIALKKLRAQEVKKDSKESGAAIAHYFRKIDYEEMLKKLGLALVDIKEFQLRMYQKSWEHISSFHDYAAGALPGYPVVNSANALKEAVAQAIEQYGERDEDNTPYIARNWLAVAARNQV